MFTERTEAKKNPVFLLLTCKYRLDNCRTWGRLGTQNISEEATAADAQSVVSGCHCCSCCHGCWEVFSTVASPMCTTTISQRFSLGTQLPLTPLPQVLGGLFSRCCCCCCLRHHRLEVYCSPCCLGCVVATYTAAATADTATLKNRRRKKTQITKIIDLKKEVSQWT